MKIILILSAALLLASASRYGKFIQTQQEELLLLEGELDSTEEFEFDQKLDHFNVQVKSTFKQRYWVNADFWDEKNGPTFVSVCGEWRCNPESPSSFLGTMAKTSKARIVTLEHRYYGDTQPFSTEQGGWSMENLQYLTADQALADVAFFVKNLLAEDTNNPWTRVFVVGGSYPGAMVSWFREKYPHIAFGALASSGVVDAVYDFNKFDEQINLASQKSGSECTSAIKGMSDVLNTLDQKKDKEGLSKIKAVFNAPNMKDFDFFFYVSDIVVEQIQYGNRPGFCDKVIGKTPDEVFKVLANIGGESGFKSYDSTYLSNTDINVQDNMRQWTYQYCSQLAYFQTPAVDVDPLRPLSMTVSAWETYCQSIFGGNITPETVDWNIRYGGKKPSVTNVIYTNGDEDPWKQASILPSEKQGNDKIYPIEIFYNGSGHCADLRAPQHTDHENMKNAHATIASLVDGWVKDELKSMKLSPEESIKSLLA